MEINLKSLEAFSAIGQLFKYIPWASTAHKPAKNILLNETYRWFNKPNLFLTWSLSNSYLRNNIQTGFFIIRIKTIAC